MLFSKIGFNVSSISYAITFLAFSPNLFVSEPAPGPISITNVSLSIAALFTIDSIIFLSIYCVYRKIYL